MILTLILDRATMTFEQIILLIIAGVGAIWGVIKFIIPKVVDARLESERDDREFRQKRAELEQSYLLSEASVAQQRLAELLQETQSFVQSTVSNSLDKIKTDTSHLPELVEQVEKLKYEFRNLQTHQRLLVSLLTELYEDYREQNRKPDMGGSNET